MDKGGLVVGIRRPSEPRAEVVTKWMEDCLKGGTVALFRKINYRPHFTLPIIRVLFFVTSSSLSLYWHVTELFLSLNWYAPSCVNYLNSWRCREIWITYSLPVPYSTLAWYWKFSKSKLREGARVNLGPRWSPSGWKTVLKGGRSLFFVKSITDRTLPYRSFESYSLSQFQVFRCIGMSLNCF